MGRTGAKTKVRRSASEKSGLQFPVRRIQRYLKNHHTVNKKARVSATAGVYLAAVLEYVSAEVLELAGMAAKHHKKRRINPRWIWLAIKSDDEFRKLLKGSVLPESGNLWGAPLGQKPAAATTGATATLPTFGSSRTGKTTKRTLPRVALNTGTAAASRAQLAAAGISAVGNDDDEPPALGTVETLGRTLVSGVQLSVLRADIVSVEADCYINPTGGTIGFGGQVGARLSAAGGPALAQIVNDSANQAIPSCGAVTTPAAGLKAHHIIHCNSPSWNETNSIQKLEQTVNNCLDEVCRNKIKTVAIPSIGSGGNNFPKQTAAQTILRTISAYFKNKPKADFDTEKIIFVLYDKQSVFVYRTELGRLVE